MLVPAVWQLARQYPDVRITVLSRAFAKALFTDLAPNVSFMEADLKGEYRGIKGLNSLYRRLTAKQFTAIADMHSVLRSEFLRLRFNLSNCRVEHINKHRRGRRRLVAATGKQLIQQPTPFENYADVLARLGYPVDIKFTSIFPPEGGDLSLLPTLNTKETGEKWIGIAPFAAHKGKVYPPKLMEHVISMLVERRPQARIMLFGRGADEDEWFERWCVRYAQCIAVSRHVENMKQELIVMSHLDVMLSMDSANMHLASLTATPVVSVWGATHPLAGFMGWKQSTDNAVQLQMDCRPCSIFGQKPCMRGDYACMNNIAPETIVERIDKILGTI